MSKAIDMRKPEQILPGLTMRVQGREGTSVSYQADGAGGVTVRVDWRHAMEFWFEFHLQPAGEKMETIQVDHRFARHLEG